MGRSVCIYFIFFRTFPHISAVFPLAGPFYRAFLVYDSWDFRGPRPGEVQRRSSQGAGAGADDVAAAFGVRWQAKRDTALARAAAGVCGRPRASESGVGASLCRRTPDASRAKASPSFRFSVMQIVFLSCTIGYRTIGAGKANAPLAVLAVLAVLAIFLTALCPAAHLRAWPGRTGLGAAQLSAVPAPPWTKPLADGAQAKSRL